MTEEWYFENDRLRSFGDTIDEAATEHEEIPDLLAALHDPFRELLTNDEWLPEPDDGLVPDGYDDKGEMGGETSVHDHLAWGLVGSYDGARTEEVYRRTDDGETDVDPVDLEHLRTEEMREDDFDELVAQSTDIHQVRTSSDVPSVKVHLLGAELGRIQRHQFDPDDEFVEVFQSHDTNVRCEEAIAPPDQHGHTRTHSHGH